uniref:Uncharacterized protein n=1 Tax=Anguilla anguilla TaxID=7936 RepID=A0A0E9RRX2_ANGAN
MRHPAGLCGPSSFLFRSNRNAEIDSAS